MVAIPPLTRTPLQIGDYVGRAGIYTKPGVIIEKKEDGTVVIDTDKDTIDKYHRHSNTSGLTAEEKEQFNSIMDEVMNSKDQGQRINKLQARIDELKSQPENKQIVYRLSNEQAQLIRLARELPRVYVYESSKIP